MSNVYSSVAFDTLASLSNPMISQKISDGVTKNIKLFHVLNVMGNKEIENGGYNYRIPVLKSLPSPTFYSGLTELATAERDDVESAQFERKYATQDITFSGTKLIKNAGDTQIVDYMAAQVDIAAEGMKDGLANATTGIFSALGETDLTGLTGLQNLVSSTPASGTTGGLDRSTRSYWQNKQRTCATGFATNGLGTMRQLSVDVFRGDETASIIVMTNSTYINFEAKLTGTLSYNLPSPKTTFGDLGFEDLYWHGAICFPDAYTPAQTAYFLNMKYLKLMVFGDRDFSIREGITPTNQDGLTARMFWAGNLICSCLNAQGVMTGYPDTNS